jgi:DNA-binding transcriptional regulator YhcF (GntR family)
VVSAVSAILGGIGAASAFGACGRSSCERQASGSNPLTGSRSEGGHIHAADERGIHLPHHQARLGHLEVRKVCGPILDQLYARLKRCGDLGRTGRPFTEHRNVPVLAINPRDPRPAWQQVTATLTEAIRSGLLAPGDEMPSIAELSALQGIGTGVIRHALEALAADGLILARRGQTPVVAGKGGSTLPGTRKRPGPGHHCRGGGCRPHVCQPMKASTIRGIHSILSGAFAAAQRWE